MVKKRTKNTWHLIFGMMLKYLLKPLDIHVELEVEVMTESPRADVLLIRRDTERWTSEQYEVLPDGLRDTDASHILLEFKYTESVSVDALLQVANNQRLYLQSNKNVKPDALRSFLISSKHPQQENLKKYGFYEVQRGVYRSNNCLIDSITLLSANTLPSTPNNVWIRCFASQRAQQEQAFAQLHQMGLQRFSDNLYWIMEGLYNILFGSETVDTENLVLEPEEIMRVGKFWEASYRARMTVEERLEGLSTEERLEGLAPEERLEGLAPEVRLQGLAPEERLEGLAPEVRLKGLAPEERLEGLAPEVRLKGLAPEVRLEGLAPEERLEGLAPEVRLKGLGLEERLQEFSPEQIAAYLQKLQQS